MIKRTAQMISWLSLAALIMPSILFLMGMLPSLERVKLFMLVATVIWFVCTPLWMKKESSSS